jgi:DNA-binding NarL/FixJ family response regulator
MTTSNAERDVARMYDLGTSSFISKPVTLSALVEVVRVLGEYWFEIVQLPRVAIES